MCTYNTSEVPLMKEQMIIFDHFRVNFFDLSLQWKDTLCVSHMTGARFTIWLVSLHHITRSDIMVVYHISDDCYKKPVFDVFCIHDILHIYVYLGTAFIIVKNKQFC